MLVIVSGAVKENRIFKILTIWAIFFYYLSVIGLNFMDILSKTFIHFIKFLFESYFSRDITNKLRQRIVAFTLYHPIIILSKIDSARLKEDRFVSSEAFAKTDSIFSTYPSKLWACLGQFIIYDCRKLSLPFLRRIYSTNAFL